MAYDVLVEITAGNRSIAAYFPGKKQHAYFKSPFYQSVFFITYETRKQVKILTIMKYINTLSLNTIYR